MRTFMVLVLAASAWAQSVEDRSRQVLDQLLARKYGEVYALFNDQLKAAIPVEKYSEQMNQLLSMGQPETIGTPKAQKVQDSTLVVIPVRWPAVALEFLFSWTADGKIQGTFVRPAAPPPSAWAPPDYAKPAEIVERELTVGDDRWKLPAFLTAPKRTGRFPAVVLVHGSGPHDADETVGGVKPFKDLAIGLASRGVAVLRYTKRTKQYPTPESAMTMTGETVDDAVRAAEVLRNQPEVDPKRVYVLGHSQGGYAMPRIVQRDPKLAGAIILAGNVRPIEELIVEQAEYLSSLSGAPSDAQKQRIAALRKNPRSGLPSIPAAYWDDLEGYNPAAEMKKLRVPVLVLQGERDYQVSMKDFALWKAALDGKPTNRFISYPKLNHLFVAGEGKSTPAEYQRTGHVAAEVVEDIAAWLLRR